MPLAKALVQIIAMFTVAAIVSAAPALWWIAPAVFAVLVVMAMLIDLALTASLDTVRRWMV